MKRYNLALLCSYLFVVAVVAYVQYRSHVEIEKIYNHIERLQESQEITCIRVTDYDAEVSIETNSTYNSKLMLPEGMSWRVTGKLYPAVVQNLTIKDGVLEISGVDSLSEISIHISDELRSRIRFEIRNSPKTYTNVSSTIEKRTTKM